MSPSRLEGTVAAVAAGAGGCVGSGALVGATVGATVGAGGMVGSGALVGSASFAASGDSVGAAQDATIVAKTTRLINIKLERFILFLLSKLNKTLRTRLVI